MKHMIELQPTDTMQRVSRKELCDKFDEWLETVSRDNVGIVITDEGKDDLVLCPSEWFEKLASNNLNRVINGAVINALLNDENQSCYVIGFIKDAMDFVSEDKSEALVTYVVMKSSIYDRHYFRLKGLDENKRYLNEQTGQILSGRTLMNAGICIQDKLKDFDSHMFHFVEVL